MKLGKYYISVSSLCLSYSFSYVVRLIHFAGMPVKGIYE